MFKDLRNIAFDKLFRIVIYENKVDINNYDDILIFDEEEVLIKIKNKLLKIKGKGLKITRLENSETLVEGQIKTIDLGD